MTVQPNFFDDIRVRSSARWDQLESDPELAAPWYQLFRQVQSPRHVVSELLQNADDAGATEAVVDIRDGEFVFAHNGDDFTADQFASICRFGYSNKRSLHTIGFRGVGFKAVFSLGDEVRLLTPTLQVAFRRERFTQPQWITEAAGAPDRTLVKVRIKDSILEREIRRNLEDWTRSPASLLFFRHIRRIRFAGIEVEWIDINAGPADNSMWVALSSCPEKRYLHIRSELAEFPDDCLAEIRQERMVSGDEGSEFPPCRTEIVLGMEGRLFVILPTGVTTTLPFACNAPFIQDPARVKIKDPGLSPTNRWLLERTGQLAASAMTSWLGEAAIDVRDRARAYDLLPDVDREDSTLEGSCASIVELALADVIEGESYVLSHTGDLCPHSGCAAFPEQLIHVWSPDQVSALFDEKKRPPLSPAVSVENRTKLLHWKAVEEISKSRVISVLERTHLPKPESWQQLVQLWDFVADEIRVHYYYDNHRGVRIFPVQGKDVLHAASEIVRLGEKKLLQSSEDWEFLAQFLVVMNPNWPRYLADLRRTAEETRDQSLARQVTRCYDVLRTLGLEESSDVGPLVDSVARAFFGQSKCPVDGCVRLARIAAGLGATAGENFRFVTRDLHLRKADHQVVVDKDGRVEGLVTPEWARSHFLHAAYFEDSRSCSADEWWSWIASGRSALITFVPLLNLRVPIWRKASLTTELKSRGYDDEVRFPYVTSDFAVLDWDFEDVHWTYWHEAAKSDPRIWSVIMREVLGQSARFWQKALGAHAVQVATTGTNQRITNGSFLPRWVTRFRLLPCLEDTRGFHRQPAELLRRTPETEALLDSEPFVHATLDAEGNRPLLDLLGVRSTPSGPDRLLDILRALSKSDTPPVHEVEKWYWRLDQLVTNGSTDDLASVNDALLHEKIVLSEASGWVCGSEAYLGSDDDDAPGAPVVRRGVRDLSLWRRVGISERPTAELAIAWLQQLSSGVPLSPEEARRVRSLLVRHPARIWEECGHWLSLDGGWAPVGDLQYAMSMQSLVPWDNLFPHVKQRTADFRRLATDVIVSPPFSSLPTLASMLEERLEELPANLQAMESRPWLAHLGEGFERVILDDDDETARVRVLGSRLRTTSWQQVEELESVPFLDGTPAGTARRTDALWNGSVLYVADRPIARLAKAVTQELGRFLRRNELVDATMACFERAPDFVTEYIEENFVLTPSRSLPVREAENAVSGLPVFEEVAAGHRGADDDGCVSATTMTQGPHSGPAEAPPSVVDEQEHAASDAFPPAPLDDASPDQSGDEDTVTRVAHLSAPKLQRPRLIDRFAKSQGFETDGADRFFRADGAWLAKCREGAFPWELRSASGDAIQYYWPKEHCLDREPLELDADIWGLCIKFPNQYSLLLVDREGDPAAIGGHRLGALKNSGRLVLYPAKYRLVLDPSNAEEIDE